MTARTSRTRKPILTLMIRVLIVLLVLLAALTGAALWQASMVAGNATTGPVRNSPFPEMARSTTLDDAAPGMRYWAYGVGSPSFVDGRAYLYDINARRLGQLSTGYWFTNLLPADRYGAILTVETYLSRGTRGERTDIVAAYDDKTLRPRYEIEIPAKRMNATQPSQMMRMTPDQRFLAVVNYTPAQSLSIVDLKERRFVEEVETPGCMGAHEGGERSFYLICSNGSFMRLRLGSDGRVVERERTGVLFDAIEDPLTASPVNAGDTWYFLSRQARVHAIRMTDTRIDHLGSWSLLSDGDRGDQWTIAGLGHLAIHRASGRLFVLMRQGKPEKFEDPGEEVWVVDTAKRQRVQRIKMKDLTVSIDVTQAEQPRLVTMDLHIPVSFLETLWILVTEGEAGFRDLLQSRVNVYDGDDGTHLVRGPVNPGGAHIAIKAW